MEQGISFENVSKIYNTGTPLEKCALNNISLDIRQGEFLGIAGMNGSGKSTMARMINGFILPTKGRVSVNGIFTSDSRSLKRIRSLVGMLFQNPDNQIISPIVEEDIAFGPANLGLSTDEVKKRTEWALSLLGLEKLRHHSPYLLSGGQKQKVAIASALAMKASYLVLDEPTSMLDAKSRSELMSTLKFLNEELKITIILISHNMEDMIEVDRLILLNNGRIFLDENPWKAFACPEKLIGIGVNIPETVRLLDGLRKRGHKIDTRYTTSEQFEEYLCRLLK